jgi:hypothetical protein
MALLSALQTGSATLVSARVFQVPVVVSKRRRLRWSRVRAAI